MTDEEKLAYDKKKKDAAEAYKNRKATAKKLVTDYLATDKRIPTEVRNAILYIAGSGGASKSGINSEIKTVFIEKQALSCTQCFELFDLGRPGMAKVIRALCTVKTPEDRVWIALEGVNYVLKGTGENPPEGWTGYTPAPKGETL